MRIRNASPTQTSVKVRQLQSEQPPPGDYPEKAGEVPLSYWQNDFEVSRAGWADFPSELIQTNLGPGATWDLRISVRRRDMASNLLGAEGATYQSLLEIVDGEGLSRRLVPVVAQGLVQSAESAMPLSLHGGPGLLDTDIPNRYAGLWVGNASIEKVSYPSSGNPDEPVSVASAFQFRLLVHVDVTGQALLLQKVLEMWKPGTLKPANDGSTNQVVDQPGRFVLLTDEALTQGLFGAYIRDGKAVGRRFSSAAFGRVPTDAMLASGPFGEPGRIAPGPAAARLPTDPGVT